MIVTAHMIALLVERVGGHAVALAGNGDDRVEHIRQLRAALPTPATLYIASWPLDSDDKGDRAEGHGAPLRLGVEGVSALDAQQLAFDAYARLQTWDDDLASLLRSDAPLEDLVSLGERMIERPFAILSRELLVIARSPGYSRGASAVGSSGDYQLSVAYVGSLVNSPDYQESTSLRDPYYFPMSVPRKLDYSVNIFLRDAYFGRLAVDVSDGAELSAGERQIIDHFARYVSDAYLRFSGNDMTSLSQNDVVHALVRDLVEGGIVPRDDVLVDALGAYGWSPDDRYTVIKLRFTERGKWETASLYMSYVLEKRHAGTCAVIVGRSIVWVVNESVGRDSALDPMRAARRGEYAGRIPLETIDRIAQGHACHAGISELFCGFQNIGAFCRQADVALRMGSRRDLRFGHHCFAEFEFDYMLEQVTREFTAEQLCHSGLLSLRDYDRLHGTVLYECLRAYLENSRNVTHAAKALFVHRTTLLRWLEKIYELTGINLDDQDEVLYLLLSYALMERSEA